MSIKYIGSKRRMVPIIVDLARSVGARSTLDMFSGSARVSVALKQAGMTVTSVDSARYAWMLAQTWVGVDGTRARQAELDQTVAVLDRLEGHPGWFTSTYCEDARYIHPSNGPKIDTIRDLIDEKYVGSWMHPCLVAAVLLSADRVDSTVGTQTAYLKTWAPRALNPFRLSAPILNPGPGTALCADATTVEVGYHDFAYLDPPYNQHNYERHYHLHEQLAVWWDKPSVSGIARKPDGGPSEISGRFTRKTSHRASLESVLSNTDAGLVVLSYSDEAFLPLETIVELCEQRGAARVLQFTAGRYIGSELGGHGPDGERVGDPGHTQNVEYMIVAGDPPKVDRVCAPYSGVAPNRLDAPGQFNLF